MPQNGRSSGGWHAGARNKVMVGGINQNLSRKHHRSLDQGFAAEVEICAQLRAAGWTVFDFYAADNVVDYWSAHFTIQQNLIRGISWSALRALNQARRGEPIDPPPPHWWVHCIGDSEFFFPSPSPELDTYVVTIVERGDNYWVEEAYKPRGPGWVEVEPRRVWRRRRVLP